jgi:hypothetical protein
VGLFLDGDHFLWVFFHAVWCGLGYCITLQGVQVLFTIDCSVNLNSESNGETETSVAILT